MDFGVSRVAMGVKGMERRRDCGEREERCGHRVYLRSLLRKETLFFLKVVKKDSQRSDQYNPEEQVSR